MRAQVCSCALHFLVFCLISDSVLRTEACLVARVRHYLFLQTNCQPKTWYKPISSSAHYWSSSSSSSLLGIWASTDSTRGAAEESNGDLEPCSMWRVRKQKRPNLKFGLDFEKQVFLRTFSAPCLNLPPRKANNLFEKNAAPILHLAGVEITIVKVCLFFPPFSPVFSVSSQSYFVTPWLLYIACSSTDRLWRPGKETDGVYGKDRHADRGRRGWHIAGSHHRLAAKARSSRWHTGIMLWFNGHRSKRFL